MKHLLSVATLLLAAICCPAQAPTTKPPDAVGQIAATLEPIRSVVYKKVGGRELRLHLFEPEGIKAGDRRSCFVAIHGGGWTGGEPRRTFPFTARCAALGMVGISVEYRLSKPGSEVTVFDCVKDGRSALRYVRAHASELGIDPQKIVANGGSAGGHVAAGTALFDGFDEAGEDPSVSCVPNALVLHFPVIDTSLEGYGNQKIGGRWQEISPLHRVRAGVPPTLIFHGTGDTTTPFKGAQFREWGLPKDEFADHEHIPYELYVRETRRIVGRHVFTEHDGSFAPGLARTPIHPDSIAVTDWDMDSHSCTTDSRPGFHYDGKLILTEESRPAQIPDRALLPQGVDNLLVPVCLSATHLAWGAIRLEPVWMQTSEAAGLAVALAKREKTTPAQLNPETLLRTLVERRQLVTFFNDIKVDAPEPSIPAAQYFGTKGFFHDYDAGVGAAREGVSVLLVAEIKERQGDR